MTYNELTNNYYVLATVNRTIPVLICRSKTTMEYDFFTPSYNGYEKVDAELEKELRKIYKPFKNGDIYHTTANSDSYNEIVQTLKKIAEPIKQKIVSFFEQSGIISKHYANINLSSVQFKHCSEDQHISPEDLVNTEMYYRASSNTVYFVKSSDQDIEIALSHELLHCAAKNSSRNTTGFVHRQTRKSKTHKVGVCFENSRGLNEGATEYYNSVINNCPHANSYEELVNIYASLEKIVGQKQMQAAYCMGGFNMLCDAVKNACHLTSDEQIVKLALITDAILNTYYCHSGYSQKANSDLSILTQEAYKILIEIAVAKYSAERYDLGKLQLSDILSNHSYDIYTQNRRQAASLEIYLSLLCNIDSQITTATTSNSIDIASNAIMGIICGFPPEDIIIPEEAKTVNFYRYLIGNWTLYDTETMETDSGKSVEKVIRTIFNPKNNFLPKNKNLLDKIVVELICSEGFYTKNIHRYIPRQLAAETLNNHPELIIPILKEDEMFILSSLSYMSDSIRSNASFAAALISKLKPYSSDIVFPVLANYFKQIKEPTEEFILKTKTGLAATKIPPEKQQELINILNEKTDSISA